MATPQWHSVALFFNLPTDARPSGYQHTASQDVLNWLDLGADPVPIKLSEFVCNYWNTLSYGNLAFGIKTPRWNGIPIIPTLTPPGNNADDWGGLIRAYLQQNAKVVWQAGGSKMKDGKRWIPSVVLVQNYPAHASAHFGGYEITVQEPWLWGNLPVTYIVGDVTHVKYDLTKNDPNDFPEIPAAQQGRKFWSTLVHEYAHNFLEFGDLYGPQGTTGYWDQLGNNSPAGRMSEVSSVFKERLGWVNFKEVIQGPDYGRYTRSLRPYTTTGEAIKIIPDPTYNPHEYFILEYRKSTGNELWRPDGGLPEEGLLITHYNTRMGLSGVWLMREAPYFDPEAADYSDRGAANWTGHTELTGVLYPQPGNNDFTPHSQPSSDFYGDRNSGLRIENIRLANGRCYFEVYIKLRTYVGWNVSISDVAVAGKFHGDRLPHMIFMRNANKAQLLRMKDNQWFAVQAANGRMGSWSMQSSDKRPLVGDFNGDGKDELYLRNGNRAGVINFTGIWNSLTVQSGWLSSWLLNDDDQHIVADVNGDGKDEIMALKSNALGVIRLTAGTNPQLQLLHRRTQGTGQWTFSSDDRIFAGRFRHAQQDDIFIVDRNAAALLTWNAAGQRLDATRFYNDRIYAWNINPGDRFYVGDFDGDGLDEIYVRSARWAGLIKWQNDQLRVIWIQRDTIDHHEGDANKQVTLDATDRSYVGTFVPGREGILHRTSNRLYTLHWDGSAMVVRQMIQSSFGGKWNLGSGDQFVLGDYHPKEADPARPHLDYIGDGITDVFIHNGWGTGTVGVNYTEWDPSRRPGQIREEIGLTWIQADHILTFITSI